jgi:hypothetical protein
MAQYMVTPSPVPVEAYFPDADRGEPDETCQVPTWVIHLLARLIIFMLEHVYGLCLDDEGRLVPVGQDGQNLPMGLVQANAASIRNPFRSSIVWMCHCHGIGQGQENWQELSDVIMAFGDGVDGFAADVPVSWLPWRDNACVVPAKSNGFGTQAASLSALLAVATVLPPASNETHAKHAHGKLPASCLAASWLPASVRQVFARAGPGPSTGPPRWPGLLSVMMSDERGQRVACPAVLIRAA